MHFMHIIRYFSFDSCLSGRYFFFFRSDMPEADQIIRLESAVQRVCLLLGEAQVLNCFIAKPQFTVQFRYFQNTFIAFTALCDFGQSLCLTPSTRS